MVLPSILVEPQSWKWYIVVIRSTTEEEEEIDEGGYLGCDDAEYGGGGSLGPANVEEEEE